MSLATQTVSLVPFSAPSGSAVRSLHAQVSRGDDTLRLSYRLDADLARIRVPERRESRAKNELWKHTCFEAFFAPGAKGERGTPGTTRDLRYVELNASPSTEWALYGFQRYREGMHELPPGEAPRVEVEAGASLLRVEVTLGRRALLAALGQAPDSMLRVALTSVVEHDDGTHTCWALKHAPDRPDFHHPAGFVLEV